VSGGGPVRATVLTLRALNLGDFLTSVPALRALRERFPDHEHVLAAPAWLEPLVRLSGAVDRMLPVDGLEPLRWAGPPPAVGVNLHGRGPESHRVLMASDPGRLVAFANRAVPESRSGPVWRPDEHEVVRWCRLLVESGIPADPGRLDLRPPPGVEPGSRDLLTIIHPGAASPARRWPPSRWAEVARAERAAGRAVIVTGSQRETSLARAVVDLAGLPDGANVAGRTGLLALAALVSQAGRVLCGDTGIAHLATAFGTPSVVLFGPVPPAEWGPPSARPQHVALWAGERGDPHGSQVDPGLLRIQASDVVRATESLDATRLSA
jgi:ADP-heptose:LPS heptosyltransferase